MSAKHRFWILLLIVLSAACTASPMHVATSAPTQESVSLVPLETATPLPTPEAVSAPKQKDLLFVEFFAVT